MYKIGDIVIYGNNGACTVMAVGKLETPGVSREKEYYTLRPYFLQGSIIYTPVDNDKVPMRRILTKEQVMQVIDGIPDLDILWINDEKKREFEYKESIHKCDCRELVRIIKTIYMRKLKRMEEGKKVTATDERYFKIAEEKLYGELSIPLEMTKEETKKFVVEQVTKNILNT